VPAKETVLSQPTRFGRYLLDRRLAMGGMAEVFLGRIAGPQGFEKRVVLKRMLPHLVGDETYTEMFLDEARLAARLNHPNLIQVYELDEVDGQYCLAMEYLDGQDIATVLETSLKLKKTIPLEITLSIIAAVADGLHYAHELKTDTGGNLKVVHRDISPANIFTTWRGGIKVVDFGIAKHEISKAKTTAGTLKGKLSYMSPEQARAEPLDRRSDIFSLGIIFYEMLTLRPCFTGRSQMDTYDNIIKLKYRPVGQYRHDLHPGIESILAKMLAAKPEDRYANAETVRREIQYLHASLHVPLADMESFLSSLFPPKQDYPQTEQVKIPSSIVSMDEINVPDAYASPNVEADKDSYLEIAAAYDATVVAPSPFVEQYDDKSEESEMELMTAIAALNTDKRLKNAPKRPTDATKIDMPLPPSKAEREKVKVLGPTEVAVSGPIAIADDDSKNSARVTKSGTNIVTLDELSKKHTIPPELLRSEKAQEEGSAPDKSGPRVLTTLLAAVLSMLGGGTVFYLLYRLAMGQPLMPF
jgi:serine/threonine protein kinase